MAESADASVSNTDERKLVWVRPPPPAPFPSSWPRTRQNEVLAEDPDHRESALHRVGEGRAELERVTAELANLRAGRALGSS